MLSFMQKPNKDIRSWKRFSQILFMRLKRVLFQSAGVEILEIFSEIKVIKQLRTFTEISVQILSLTKK